MYQILAKNPEICDPVLSFYTKFTLRAQFISLGEWIKSKFMLIIAYRKLTLA